MTVRIVSDGPRARDEAAVVIASGGVVALPTDTVYGLAAARTDRAAIARLVSMKGRALDKGIAMLLAEPDQAAEVGLLTPLAELLGRALWPGGLTLVVPARPDAGIAEAVLGPGGTVGLRVPDHPCPRRIAEITGPLPATSANVSGGPEAPDGPTIVRLFGAAVDLVVDGGAAGGGPGSTVVDCTATRPRILRLGAVAEQRIDDVLRRAGVGR